MNAENRVAVVTDSGSSMRPDSPEAIEFGVSVVPLEVHFWENGKYVPYPDTDIPVAEFYERMRTDEVLPLTSGAVPGRFIETFTRLSELNRPIISIDITSKRSGAWAAAVLAKNTVIEKAREEGKELKPIKVIDSGLVSIATWFPAQLAGALAEQGATADQIQAEVLETLSKTQIYATLETFENLKKGGRAEEIVKAVLASMLHIYPVLGFKDGVLKEVTKGRSPQKAREQMVELVGDSGKLAKVAVVHTNALQTAERTKEALEKIYKGPIPIYEAGPVLAVHAGEGGIGIAFQTT